MEEHMLYDEEKDLWICKKCDKQHTTKTNLKQHLNRKFPCTVDAKIEYTCPKCLKKFNNKSWYTKHTEMKSNCSTKPNAPINKTHTPEPNYKELYEELELTIAKQKEEYESLKTLSKEREAKLINDRDSIRTDLITDYVEHIVDNRDIKLSTISFYIFNIKPTKKTFFFLLDHTTLDFFDSIVTQINNKQFFIDLVNDYHSNLLKKDNKYLYGKNVNYYANLIKNKLLS
jgi:hypothetical protein